jgi:O-6-methylguanine DNA methyltransferase
MTGIVSFWSVKTAGLGRLRLAATEVGLCKLALGRESDDVFYSWLARKIRPAGLVRQQTPIIEGALAEIHAYLTSGLQTLSTRLDLRGTPFQRQVWSEVTRIPYGTTASYREVALRIDRPKAVRAVGAANAANPLPLFVPCHRVVGVDGALRGYGGGLELKQTLLRLEAVGKSA